jgi:hypothetical protein
MPFLHLPALQLFRKLAPCLCETHFQIPRIGVKIPHIPKELNRVTLSDPTKLPEPLVVRRGVSPFSQAGMMYKSADVLCQQKRLRDHLVMAPRMHEVHFEPLTAQESSDLEKKRSGYSTGAKNDSMPAETSGDAVGSEERMRAKIIRPLREDPLHPPHRVGFHRTDIHHQRTGMDHPSDCAQTFL